MILIFILNLISFFVFYLDKIYARKGMYRIPEKTLLFFSFFAPYGSIFSMLTFRHKIRKNKFFALVIIFLFLNLYILKAAYF